MSVSAEQLRKAALLVAALDDAAADSLLERMSPEQAGLIRRTVFELRRIDPAEQQSVIREFFDVGDRPPRPDDAGVELDLDRVDAARRSSSDAPPALSDAPPFRFLHEAAEADLGELLAAESPQVATVVVSQLPPDQAARALAALPDAVRTDVVRRLARLDGSDAGVLREVEAGLQQRYHRRFRFAGRRAVGLSGVKQILQEAASEDRGLWLASISQDDPHLAAQLAGPSLEISFDELDGLTDESLQLLLETVDESLTVLALAGAELTLLTRMLGTLPRVHASRLQRAIDTLGTMRLSDVDAAQEQIVAEAVRLQSLGRLTWRDADGPETIAPRDLAAA